MAAIVSAGSGLWSATATWVGGVVPVDGDSVTIDTGHEVEFDVDQSAWATGLAGLVINGTLTASETAGTYHLKMAANVTGTGQLIAGSSETSYPIDCKFEIHIDGAFSIELSASGAVQLHCTETTHKLVKTTADVLAGATSIPIDTDLTADVYWGSGAEITCANPVDRYYDSAEIDGVTSDTITLTSGIARNYPAESYIVVMDRNIEVKGGGAAVTKGFDGVSAPHVSARIYDCQYCLYDAPNAVIGGVNVAGAYAFSGCDNAVFGGVALGGTARFNNSDHISFNGISIGNSYGLSACDYAIIGASAIVAATNSAMYNCNFPIYLGLVDGGYYGIRSVTGGVVYGTIKNTTYGISICSLVSLQSAEIRSNTAAVIDSVGISMQDTLIDAPSEFSGYADLPSYVYSDSIDHDQVPGAYRAWTRGGICDRVTDVYPSGKTESYRLACESADYPCFHQREISVEPGQLVRFAVYGYQEAGVPLTIELIDKTSDPLIDDTATSIDSWSPTADAEWQSTSFQYRNTGLNTQTLIIRESATAASGFAYALIEQEQDGFTVSDRALIEATATQASVDIIDALIDAIKAKTDNLPADPADQSDLIAAIGAITGTTPEEIWTYATRELTSDTSLSADNFAAVMDAYLAAADPGAPPLITPPDNGEDCAVGVFIGGASVAGGYPDSVEFEARIKTLPYQAYSRFWTGKKIPWTYNSTTGAIGFTVVRGAVVEIRLLSHDLRKQIKIPDAATLVVTI